MTKSQQELLDNLLRWKTSLLESSDYSFEKSIGVESVEDLLDNIAYYDSKGQYYPCLASELISRLTKEELNEVKYELIFNNEYSDVNFDNLSVKYYI